MASAIPANDAASMTTHDMFAASLLLPESGQPRMSQILAGLRQAKIDWHAALDEPLGGDWDARMTDAERRTERLMKEFRALILAATGVQWSEIEAAIEDAVL